MQKLTIQQVIKASKAENKPEKFSTALQISSNLTDFLLILSESFDYTSEEITEIENMVLKSPIELEHNFLKVIDEIKKSKDGFKALLFCLKHFGFQEAEHALVNIFDVKSNQSYYHNALVELHKFVDSESQKLVKTKRISKKVVIEEVTGIFVQERVYKPVYSKASGQFGVAIYGQNGVGPKLIKVVTHNQKVLDGTVLEEENNWKNNTCKVIFANIIRNSRKDFNLHIQSEGSSRRVSFYKKGVK